MLRAQNPDIRVSGTVLSASGSPLQYASIQVKRTTRGTTTDSLGKFSIMAPPSGTLVISYAGYQPQEVQVANQSALSIVLNAAVDSSMSDVVVVGYTTQRRNSISGALSTVNMENTEVRRVANVGQMLQGQVPGLNVTSATGAPGDGIDIKVRGVGTIGSTSPLFVVDGIPATDITFLNPTDIASMSILRDASAAAMYGSRSANGVIVITTKTGKKGRNSLDLNYFRGIQQAGNLPKMLNGRQYMAKMEESWNNTIGYSPSNNPYTADKNRSDLANTNWLDELFETGYSQNVQLSASGGSDKVQYLLSGTYYQENGIVVFDNDKFRRLTFRTNINASLSDRLRVGTNIQLGNTAFSRISSRGDAPGIIRHALIRPPVIPVYKDPSDPTWKARDPFTDLPFYKNNNLAAGGWESEYEYTSNPIALAYFTNDRVNNLKTFGNFYAEYGFLKNQALKLRTNVGIDLTMGHSKKFNQNFGDDNGGGEDADKGLGRQNRPNSLDEARGEEYAVTWNNTLNYSTRINKHSISALVGTEYITYRSDNMGGSRRRFEYSDPSFQYLDYGSDGSVTDMRSSGSAIESTLFSVFGSATYMYDSKYMLTANLRADASSRFGPNNRWGYFPSVSAGWRISEESFMKSAKWLSDLRLRASVGKLGNQQFEDYQWQQLMRKVGDDYVIARYGNPDLKWESTTQTNFGADITIARKLSVSVDYFIKNTSDILLPVNLPLSTGFVDPTYINAAKVSNKGIELAINYKNYDNAFKYALGANLATVTNKVEQLHPNLPVRVGDYWRDQPGTPLGSFYGYVMEGIYQNTAEVQQHLFNTLNAGAPDHPREQPGDIRFKDLDNNGVIDDKDRTFIGNPVPKMTYGVTMSGSYKGFDLNILFQGIQDVDKFNEMKKITDYDTRPFNHSVRTLEAWNGEGSSNSTPRSTFSDNGSSRMSSIYIEDASYMRLKNVELGYSFRSLLGKAVPQIQNLRVYVSAQNLFTVTQYKGLDPESTDSRDMGTYPLAKSFIFGVNMTF
ncbi:TonB-dependent receptor [Filimonas effusa]|uniref:TonB-dependent receptor n=2 Tax=Filimonas effusa TaxID=2508721 RepID=A0A4Q1D682_9BACT|nr:TonB-dependent receptor [Filimonas effusa]